MSKYDLVIQEVAETITILEEQVNDENIEMGISLQIESEKIKLEALQQAKEREENPPLTLEQLRERVGKPVYTRYINVSPHIDNWEILCGINDMYITLCSENDGGIYDCDICTFGKTWLAFDHEPKGE